MTQVSNIMHFRMSESDNVVIRQEKTINPNGETVLYRYAQNRLIGRGGFAKVYQVNCLETNKVYAAKITAKASLTSEMIMQKLKAEVKLHQTLNHPHVVKFERYFEDEDNVYILLELCSNESLGALVHKRIRLTEEEAQYYLYQTIQGLKYLHDQNILHRDLKPANLLLNSEMQLKIADFGLAAKLSSDSEKRKTICGTPNYLAPEVLENRRGYSFPADIWALGVICYNLLTGKLPFEALTSKEIYSRIQEGKYTFPANVTVSSEAKDFIGKILVLEPEKRPSLNQLLRHPFLKPKGGIPESIPTSTLSLPPVSSYTKQFKITEEPPKLSKLFQKAENAKEARYQSAERGSAVRSSSAKTSLADKAKPKLKIVPEAKVIENKSDSSDKNANAETKTSLNKENGGTKDEAKSPGITREPLLEANDTNSRSTPKNEHQQQQQQHHVRNRSSAPKTGGLQNYFAYGVNRVGTSQKERMGAIKNILTPNMKQFNEFVDKKETATAHPQRANSSPKKLPAVATITSNVNANVNQSSNRPGNLKNLFIHTKSKQMTEMKKKELTLPGPEETLRQGTEREISPTIKSKQEVSPTIKSRQSLDAKPLNSSRSPTRIKLEEEKEATVAEKNNFVKALYWLDETAEIGIAYTLSNGALGILFNDDTKIILDEGELNFDYIETGAGHQEMREHYSMINYPEELKDKVAFLERANIHFTKTGQKKKVGSLQGTCDFYIRKWLKTKHATLFRLNTQELQVVFIDNSLLTLSQDGKDMRFITAAGEFSKFNLEKDSLRKDSDAKKRLVYTMEVMDKIWNKKKGK